MIAIDIKQNLVRISVLGEFTIADFKQFEEHMLYGIKFQGSVNLLIDLRDIYRPDEVVRHGFTYLSVGRRTPDAPAKA